MKLAPAIRVSHAAAIPCNTLPTIKVGKLRLNPVSIIVTPPFIIPRPASVRPTEIANSWALDLVSSTPYIRAISITI